MATAVDKAVTNHSVTPQPNTHDRNLASFLYHHREFSRAERPALAEPRFYDALNKALDGTWKQLPESHLPRHSTGHRRGHSGGC